MASGIEVFTDIHGRLHLPLFNLYNNYCWYITALQRLQCSKTLSDLLERNQKETASDNQDVNAFISDVVTPIKILGHLTRENANEIITQLQAYFKEHSSRYSSSEGFSTNMYLSKYVFPIVYHLLRKDSSEVACQSMVSIMREVGMGSSSIQQTVNVITLPYNIAPISGQVEEAFVGTVYKEFHDEFIPFLNKHPFGIALQDRASTEMELWSSTNNGHIVPLVQCVMKNGAREWIVFDDHRFSGVLSSYLCHDYNFYKLKFPVPDEEFAKYVSDQINKARRRFKFEKTLTSLSFILDGPSQKLTPNMTIAGGMVSTEGAQYGNVIQDEPFFEEPSLEAECPNNCLFWILLIGFVIAVICLVVYSCRTVEVLKKTENFKKLQ